MNLKIEKKYRILIIMVAAMIFSYLTWYNFSALLNFIVEDIKLNPGEVGIILSAFQTGYVIAVIFSGWLADKLGEKKVLVYSMLGTAIFSTLFAWGAISFWSVLILRLFAGIFCGGIYAPGMSLLSNWFTSSERGKSLGAYIGGLTFSYGTTYFIAPLIASEFSWQIAVMATSLPAFLAAFLVHKYVEKSPKNKISEEYKEELVEKDIKPFPEGGYKGPVLITLSYIGHMWELYGFWGWIGPFMVSAVAAAGYSQVQASVLGGRLASLIIMVGVPGVWLMGYLSDRLGRTKTIMISALCSLLAQFIFGIFHGKSLIITVVIGIWIGFWVIADSACFSTGLTEMVNVDIKATTLGIQNAFGFLITIISPAVFGRVLQHYNNVDNVISATNWLLPFSVLGLGALIAPIAAWFLRKTDQASLMSDGKK
ncbi:MAG: MFS transporter [Halanaerobiales bacterium]